MGKKKGKEKDKSKKQAERSVEQPVEQLGDVSSSSEGEASEQSLMNAMKAARESAMALQEAASAFSRQMSATNELLATQSAQGLGESAGADADAASLAAGAVDPAAAGRAATSAAAGLSGGVHAAGMAGYGNSEGVAGGGYAAHYGYQGVAGAGMEPYPAANQAFGRATNYRSLGASRRANKAQAGLVPAMSDPMYPTGTSAYGYTQNAPQNMQQSYGAAYRPMPEGYGAAYQPGMSQTQSQAQQANLYGTPYQGYASPYGYGNTESSAAQDMSRAAAQQVAAAQSAAFNAASIANAANTANTAAGAANATTVPSGASAVADTGAYDTAASTYNAYGQNPAYAVNEDLLTNLPKFGEAPYPLPEPHEILESVPSLQSLAYGTTAAQMHTDPYASQPSSASSATGYAADAADYAYAQPTEPEEDGVIFAYVEEAEPIDLIDKPDTKKSKKKKKKGAAEEEGYYQHYAGVTAYGGQDMEEISIPAVYGSEEGFSVELPMEAESEAVYARPGTEEVSAVYYEVDESADGSGYASYEGWTQESEAYESYDGYYYDEAGNVFYYDENGYPYYYGEDGNAYYYDNYDGYGYGAQPMPSGKQSTGMVLGILSILLAFIPIVGLILGIVASKKAKKHINMGGTSPNAYTAKLLGKLGIILSIVLFVVYIGLVVAYFLALYPADVMRAIRTFLADTPLSFVL